MPEEIKIVAVSGAIIVRKNSQNMWELLLIRRSPKDNWPFVWEFPRGKCTIDKTLNDCLMREVREETGLDVVLKKFIDKYEYLADDKEGKRKSIQFNFLCKMKNEKQKVNLSFEHDEFKWVSSVGQVELLVPSEMKKTISKVLNVKEQIVTYPSNSKTQNIDEKISSFLENIFGEK